MVIPSYGMFSKLPGATEIALLDVHFGGAKHSVSVYDVPGREADVRNVVFEHPLFSPLGPGKVYCELEGEGPFATDATKFAFFAATTVAWIEQLPTLPDAVHLHDWHAAMVCFLREFSVAHERLQQIRTVFTIHNLSYQGTRPLAGDESSLESWFPDIEYDTTIVRDPTETGCVNPMALAIRTADRISTVSPTYAEEILRPSDNSTGFIGGEGLEAQLGNAARANRLVGILNGCEYNGIPKRRPGWQRIINEARDQVQQWLQMRPEDPAHKLALERLEALPKRRPAHLLTSIGRLVRQKVSLFLEETPDGRSALEHIVDNLGTQGVLILLGSGEPEFERRITDIAAGCPRLVFLRGYSETLADPLYRAGDLFLMPSSFEPCGISQMLAMRAAQPCVVHGVGGLRDTVEDGRTGFVFAGETPTRQAESFVTCVETALTLKTTNPNRWQNLCIRASSQRFDWSTAARRTIEELYEPED